MKSFVALSALAAATAGDYTELPGFKALVANVDMNFNGFYDFTDVPKTANYQDCQRLCQENSDCKVGFYIYQGARTGECWLAPEQVETAAQGNTCPESSPCLSFIDEAHTTQ